MSYEVYINADYNDGDILSKTYRVTELDFPKFLRVSDIITKQGIHGYNWPDSESLDDTVESMYQGKLTEDEISWFRDNFLPYCEQGIHTIYEIAYYTEPQKHYVLKRGA